MYVNVYNIILYKQKKKNIDLMKHDNQKGKEKLERALRRKKKLYQIRSSNIT